MIVRRVIKIGGSLLASPERLASARLWLDEERRARPLEQRLIVVGGGVAVDALRALDRQRPQSHMTMHWAAIAEMDRNTARLAEAWGWDRPIDHLPCATLPGDWMLCVARLLREASHDWPGPELPIGWDVTSDSIAGHIALAVRAPLALVKSAPPPASEKAVGDAALMARRGYVDAFFPRLVDAGLDFSIVPMG